MYELTLKPKAMYIRRWAVKRIGIWILNTEKKQKNSGKYRYMPVINVVVGSDEY